eukprot:13973887-Ditylum_brightwellii.AAC.1
MQQLDHQLIIYHKKITDNLTEAARIAIRMLVEDEYILNDAYIAAIDTLIEYTDSELSKEYLEESPCVKRKLVVLRGSAKVENQQHVHRRSMSVRRSSYADIKTDVLELSKFGLSDDVRTDFESVSECNRGDVTVEEF